MLRATPRRASLSTSNVVSGNTKLTPVVDTYFDRVAFDAPPPPPPPPPGGSELGMETIRSAPPAPPSASAPVLLAPYYTAAQQNGTMPQAGQPTQRVTRQGEPRMPTGSPYAMPGERTWNCCGLPCESGISMWQFGVVAGGCFYFGEDAGEPCSYAGINFGRTFCGCWGLDLFYRWHSGRFERDLPNGQTFDDGTEWPDGWHHIGIKFNYGRSISGSRFYWFVGAGPEYWWTEGYIDDDSGFGIYAEAGIGYRISQNFSVQAAVMAHGMDTEVTRKNPLDDGDSRWMWVVAPTVGVHVHF